MSEPRGRGEAVGGGVRHEHRAPADCPVCGEHLSVTRLGCTSCGTELAGLFAPCPFCALGQKEMDLLRVFLASRGNLREVEKHLGVSYPTARQRFNDLLVRLGLGEPAEAPAPPATSAPSQQAPDAAPPNGPAASVRASREDILAGVAQGRISPEEARRLLS